MLAGLDWFEIILILPILNPHQLAWVFKKKKKKPIIIGKLC
jgi:hypothetical protein